jgi:hypothetical protein
MTRRSKAIAAGACAALLLALAMTSSAMADAHGRKKPLIVAPRPGKVIGARPIGIRIRTGHARAFHAQLNGHPIARYFSHPSNRGVRKLQVTPTYGLKDGKNRLHVRVKRADGGSRSRWSRFRIRHNRPLAAAGLPRTVNAGDEVYLDSTRSRSHLAAAATPESGKAGRRASLNHHWSVVRVPKGAPPGAADMNGANTPTPLFRTTVPGRYRVRLTVTAKDGAKGSASLPVKALNPPLVSVDTMTETSGGQPGIGVGGQTYAADTAIKNPWWQVLVLDGKTLEKVSNTTYPCNRAGNGFCDDSQLQKDLGKLDDTDLVIAANHMSDSSWVAPGYTSFHKIGAKDYKSQDLPKDGVASFSAIGVPDTSEGQGNWHLDPAKGSGGEMQGHLIIDNTGYYTYLAPKTTFDTQVYGSNSSQNVVQVGEKKITQQLALDPNQNGAGGFQVVVIPRQDPAGAQSYWFPTGEQDFDSGEPGRLDAMTSRLQQADSGDNIVIVASRGNPATQAGRQDQQLNVNNAVKRLVDQIEALGGTRTDAFQALAPGVTKSGASYTLIGHSGAGTAHGVEAQGQSTTAAKALNQVPLSGTLVRGHDYGFDVADTSPSQIHNPSDPPEHMAGQKLDETLVQAPTQWPDQSGAATPSCPQHRSSPDATTAIAYIGQQKFGGDDIRTDYWRSGKGDSFWQQKQTDIKNVSYPGGSPGFSASDLDWAKCEIGQEITWLLAARDFTRGLATPFAKEGLQSWADLNNIATQVDNSVQGAPKNKASLIAGAIFDGAREIATEIPVIGEGVGIVNQVYDTALEITKIATENDEPAGDEYKVDAAKFGSEMVTRLNAARDTLTDEMTDAIVADYGKLKTVGACDLLDTKNCPDNPQAWKFDGSDQTSAAKSLQYGAQLQDYAALVPTKWTLWQLGSECDGSDHYTCWETGFQGDGFGAQVVFGHVCPFLNGYTSTSLIRPEFRDIPNYRNDTGFGNGPPNVDIWQVYSLGNLVNPGATSPYRMDLPSNFLTRLFATPDPAGNISKGGLGAQREQFFLGNMTPKLMGKGGQEFPYNASDTQWFGRHTDCTAQP